MCVTFFIHTGFWNITTFLISCFHDRVDIATPVRQFKSRESGFAVHFLREICEIGADTIIDENHLYAGVEGHLVVLQGVGTFTVLSTVVILAVIEAGARRDVIGNLWVEVFKSGKNCKNDTFILRKNSSWQYSNRITRIVGKVFACGLDIQCTKDTCV